MKKFITILSSFALIGSVSYAMEEGDDMGMEMEAPSVSLSGEAELGFKNVDDDDDATEDFHLIRKYQVNFSSQGTTDGGLVFGAGISIEDEHEGDANKVNGSNVYVGGSDGSWKLKLGGNDPGIEQAGGIGVADDIFHGGDSAAIGLEGAFGGTSYRLTVADPQATGVADGDWSLGVSHSLGDVNIGVGMDSESGLAISAGTDVSGVGLTAYYSKSELKDQDLDDMAIPLELAAPGDAPDPITVDYTNASNAYNAYMASNVELGSKEWTGLGVKASISAGEGATLSLGYSTSKMEQMENKPKALDRVLIANETEATDDNDATGQVDSTLGNYTLRNAEDWNGSAKTSLIELEFAYDLGGGAKLIAAIDKKTTETLMLDQASHETSDAGVITPTDATDTAEVITYSTSVHETDETALEIKLAFTF